MNLLSKFIDKHILAPSRRMKETQFEELHPAGGEVLFLGDSITEGGAWHEWFPDVQVLNRGISSDTTAGVLGRVNTALRGGPSKVFLLIGTNDIALKTPRAQSVENVAETVRRIRSGQNAPEVILQSVMPRKAKFATRIRELNHEYEKLAAGPGIQYLDLWPALSDNDGALRPEFTLDGLHLTGAGYRAWTRVLEPMVNDGQQPAQAGPSS